MGTGLTFSLHLHTCFQIMNSKFQRAQLFYKPPSFKKKKKKKAWTLTLAIRNFVNTRCLKCYNQGILQIFFPRSRGRMEKRESPKELYSAFLSGSKAVKGPWRNVLSLCYWPLFPEKTGNEAPSSVICLPPFYTEIGWFQSHP